MKHYNWIQCGADAARSEIAWFQWLTNSYLKEILEKPEKTPTQGPQNRCLEAGDIILTNEEWTLSPLGKEVCLLNKVAQFFSPVNLKLLYPKIEIKSQLGIKDTDGD